MKKLVLLIVLLVNCLSFAQESYKYAIIPKKFNFFKEENKYDLNVITKSFFENQGFEVYFNSDILPDELSENRCASIYVDAFEESSLFLTKVYFEVKDCSNNVLIKSELGTSREKDYKKAFNEAFGKALNSIKSKLDFKKSDSNKDLILKSGKEVVSKSKELPYRLFAITTSTGYKLVNEKPETVFLLYKTSDNFVFLAIKGEIKGVFIKKNDQWLFEHYEGENLISEVVDVKF
ncbi:hypothetical protein FLCU109888_10605 [Flavobacterium cucumis]|uniref:Uncharacterized protein n=1 Tax=Flavobacterium cucumis TaxID=416016 RepID=A0A1M7ZX33_9FLAO|nr:hypothetical protein [Flavobacterium cucumis]SHO73360.1 hypothetical protein SAMN05443547_1717 [Flavobacterium cucumis]